MKETKKITSIIISLIMLVLIILTIQVISVIQDVNMIGSGDDSIGGGGVESDIPIISNLFDFSNITKIFNSIIWMVGFLAGLVTIYLYIKSNGFLHSWVFLAIGILLLLSWFTLFAGGIALVLLVVLWFQYYKTLKTTDEII